MKKYLQLLIGCVICAIFIGYFVYYLDFQQLGNALMEAGGRWYLIVLALASIAVNMVFRGFRYYFILYQYKTMNAWRAINLTCINFMGNAVLPFRAGEIARILLARQQAGVPLPAAASAQVVDRICDMASIVLLLGIAMAITPLNEAQAGVMIPGFNITLGTLLRTSGTQLTIAAIVGLIGLFVLAHFPWLADGLIRVVARILPQKYQHRFVQWSETFLQALFIFRDLKAGVFSVILSGLVWGTVFLSFWFAGGAFSIWLSVGQVLFLMVAVAFVVALPSVPGYWGLFHAGVEMVVFNIFGFDQQTVKAYAIIVHLTHQLPVIVMGFLALQWEGISLGDIRGASTQQIDNEIKEDNTDE